MRTAAAALVLICSLNAASAFAEQVPLPDAAQDIPPVPLPPPPPPKSPKKNPFLWPGLAIVAGGSAMAIYGYATDSYFAGSVAVAGGSSGGAVAVAAPGGAVSMGGVGVAVAALGGLVIYIGHLEAKNASPMIVVGPRRATVSIRFGR